MRLFDVNIFVYAHREDSPKHTSIRSYVEQCAKGPEPFFYSPQVLSGFMRIVTHPRIFNPPTELGLAVEFCNSIAGIPDAVPLLPGASHWSIFTHLVQASGAKGNLIPDAWLAALAIEHGCTWVTTDRDYTRFPGLRLEFPE